MMEGTDAARRGAHPPELSPCRQLAEHPLALAVGYVAVSHSRMAYTDAADALRHCTARRRDGAPCGAYAVWEDPERRCWRHGGKRPKPPRKSWAELTGRVKRHHRPACR